MYRSKCWGIGTLAFVFPLQVLAADLGREFDSYRDMHRDTQYGSLFFNRGAIRYTDSRSKKRFVQINGSGEIQLPAQEGYCFVFNHFSDNPDEVRFAPQRYSVKISKTFEDGRETTQILERDFTPTDDLVSPYLPDWCIAAISTALKVSLEFKSADRIFDRRISFPVKR